MKRNFTLKNVICPCCCDWINTDVIEEQLYRNLFPPSWKIILSHHFMFETLNFFVLLWTIWRRARKSPTFLSLLELGSTMRNLLRSSRKMPSRKTLMDPTKNLEDSLNTNNVNRIKSAIVTPCVDLNFRITKHQQMTILMRFCYMDISAKSRKDLTNLVLKVQDFHALNAQDLTGKTALVHACLQQDEAMIKLLSENGMTDSDIADDEGDTALMHACRTGNPDIVEALITSFKKYGLNVNASNNQGISPLLEAARLGHTSVIRVLVLEGGVDVTQRDKDRNSALDYLVTSGNGSTPDFLLICPAAQRKRMARQRRLAEGRKSMLDLVNESTIPRRAWVDEPSPRPKQNKKVEILSMQGSYSTSSLSLPFTRDYTGQLNSVVFQMAQCVPMLVEKPIEEEMEDVQRICSRMNNRRRSSSLPDLQEFQASVLSKYLVKDSLDLGSRAESESELSPRKPDGGRRKTSLLNDGRLRLQPLSKDGLSKGNAKTENERPRTLGQRRSSLPTDVPLYTQSDQHQKDQPVSQKPATRRRGSLSSLDDDLKPSSKSNPGSPKKAPDPPSPSSKTQKQGRRLSDSFDDQQDHNNSRLHNKSRRSSLPLLNANNNSVLSASSSSSPSSSTRVRRVTHPVGQKKANGDDISAVYRPRAVESRVSTSWEGKSSKKVPSYLFR